MEFYTCRHRTHTTGFSSPKKKKKKKFAKKKSGVLQPVWHFRSCGFVANVSYWNQQSTLLKEWMWGWKYSVDFTRWVCLHIHGVAQSVLHPHRVIPGGTCDTIACTTLVFCRVNSWWQVTQWVEVYADILIRLTKNVASLASRLPWTF